MTNLYQFSVCSTFFASGSKHIDNGDIYPQWRYLRWTNRSNQTWDCRSWTYLKVNSTNTKQWTTDYSTPNCCRGTRWEFPVGRHGAGNDRAPDAASCSWNPQHPKILRSTESICSLVDDNKIQQMCIIILKNASVFFLTSSTLVEVVCWSLKMLRQQFIFRGIRYLFVGSGWSLGMVGNSSQHHGISPARHENETVFDDYDYKLANLRCKAKKRWTLTGWSCGHDALWLKTLPWRVWGFDMSFFFFSILKLYSFQC